MLRSLQMKRLALLSILLLFTSCGKDSTPQSSSKSAVKEETQSQNPDISKIKLTKSEYVRLSEAGKPSFQNIGIIENPQDGLESQLEAEVLPIVKAGGALDTVYKLWQISHSIKCLSKNKPKLVLNLLTKDDGKTIEERELKLNEELSVEASKYSYFVKIKASDYQGCEKVSFSFTLLSK